MLRLNKLTDYSIVILTALAKRANETLSATVLAAELQLTLPMVSKVLKHLADAKFVSSTRGPQGGYQLAKASSDITLAGIVQALEHNPGITACSTDENQCDQTQHCLVKENWQLINKAVMLTLDSITLSDMTQPLTEHPVILHGITLKPSQEIAYER